MTQTYMQREMAALRAALAELKGAATYLHPRVRRAVERAQDAAGNIARALDLPDDARPSGGAAA
ncbi:hypothetical protein [Zavarzinia sp. CC-PAN008]|uniref:hypothetical protein n=1 Tax=Zavarzinia sp. CC-PAN008 TaxID=3243332 RepID=UPI003F743250